MRLNEQLPPFLFLGNSLEVGLESNNEAKIVGAVLTSLSGFYLWVDGKPMEAKELKFGFEGEAATEFINGLLDFALLNGYRKPLAPLKLGRPKTILNDQPEISDVA